MSRLHIGDVHTVTATFRNAAAALANPTTVTLRIKKPDGVESVVAQGSLTNSSTGVWTYAISIDQVGPWSYAYIGTGSVAAAEPGEFYVNRSEVMT